MINQLIVEKIIEAMKNGDKEILSELTLENEDDFEGPTDVFLFRLAVKNNLYDYVEENIYNVDLDDDENGSCSYLYLTSDERMLGILEDNGRLDDPDNYLGYRFACGYLGEVIIISFDDDFRKEVLTKYLEKHNTSEEKFLELNQKIYNESATPDEIEWSKDIMDGLNELGVCIENDQFVFLDPDAADLHGGMVADMLTELGYNLTFSGTSSRLQGREGFEYLV